MISGTRPLPGDVLAPGALPRALSPARRHRFNAGPLARATAGLIALVDHPAVVFLFGFAAMLPYPAVRAGAHSALQGGNLLSLLMFVPCLFVPWSRRPFCLCLILVMPVLISMGKVAATGGDLDLCLKAVAANTLCGLALVVTQRAAPRHALSLLTGLAAATLLHAAVGAWQVYAFPRGYVPLLGLYVNPSFFSVQDNAANITQYIRRPFGLFPEPSAMSSCLAPWAVFWAAEAMGLVRLRQPPARWQRALFVSASAGAVGLIIMSRSGHAVVTLAALAVCAVTWLCRSPATGRTYFKIALGFGAALPLLFWLAAASLSERVGGGSALAEASWNARANSLWVGFTLWAQRDPWTLALGLGPGLMSPAVRKATGYAAVWSVVLPYVYQMGLPGLAALCAIGRLLWRVWKASRLATAFAAVLGVWLAGVTVTTSYPQLLPLWLTLSWLIAWPEVCLPAEPGGAFRWRRALRRGSTGRFARRRAGRLPGAAATA